jgi:hypothetical protein
LWQDATTETESGSERTAEEGTKSTFHAGAPKWNRGEGRRIRRMLDHGQLGRRSVWQVCTMQWMAMTVRQRVGRTGRDKPKRSGNIASSRDRATNRPTEPVASGNGYGVVLVRRPAGTLTSAVAGPHRCADRGDAGLSRLRGQCMLTFGRGEWRSPVSAQRSGR